MKIVVQIQFRSSDHGEQTFIWIVLTRIEKRSLPPSVILSKKVSVEDIIIWGRRPRAGEGPRIDTGTVPTGTADNGITTRPSFNTDSSGGAWSPQAIVYVPYKTKCPTKEASADSIKDAIKALPSGDNYEYAASIVERSPGVFTSSGQTLATMRSTNTAPEVTLVADLTFLRGSLHNHPRSTLKPNQKLVIRSLIRQPTFCISWMKIGTYALIPTLIEPTCHLIRKLTQKWPG